MEKGKYKMRKIFQILATVVLVVTLTFLGSNHVVKAQGTSPCSDTGAGGSTCSTYTDFGGLGVGFTATVAEVPNDDILGITGPAPTGLHIVGPGANVWVFDKDGNPVDWVNPAFKVCFPVYDGQVRLWVPPEELSLPEWFGIHFTYGIWEPVTTIFENGMTCGVWHEPEGVFAVFHTDASNP